MLSGRLNWNSTTSTPRNILRLTEKLPAKDRHIVNSLVKYETDVENVLIAIKRRGKSEVDLDEIFPVTYGISKDDLEADYRG